MCWDIKNDRRSKTPANKLERKKEDGKFGDTNGDTLALGSGCHRATRKLPYPLLKHKKNNMAQASPRQKMIHSLLRFDEFQANLSHNTISCTIIRKDA